MMENVTRFKAALAAVLADYPRLTEEERAQIESAVAAG